MGRTNHQELLDSEDELMDEGETDSLDGLGGRRRSGRQNNRSATRNDNNGRRSRGRNQQTNNGSRPRPNRRNGYEIEDESMLDDLLETDKDQTIDIETVDQLVGDQKTAELDIKLEFLIAQNNFKDIKDGDTYSQRGSKSKGAVIIKEGKLKDLESNYTDSVFTLKDKASNMD